MKTVLALLLALAAAGAPAASPAGKPGPRALAFELAPGKVHEECMRLEAGRAREWSWKSGVPVDFNIHYHRGDDATYPVMREGMASASGRFVAKSAEDYCWMWTGGKVPAKVTGTIGAEE